MDGTHICTASELMRWLNALLCFVDAKYDTLDKGHCRGSKSNDHGSKSKDQLYLDYLLSALSDARATESRRNILSQEKSQELRQQPKSLEKSQKLRKQPKSRPRANKRA